MGQVCQICNHPNRLEIDRELVKGISHSKIANQFGVDSQAVRRHGELHLSRQLVKSYEMRQAIESTGLVTEIQELLKRSKHILRRAERDDKLSLALGAIRETRGTLELMARICSTIFQIEQAQLHAQQEQEQGSHSAEFIEGYRSLTDGEQALYRAIIEKMEGLRDDDIIRTHVQEVKAESFTAWQNLCGIEPGKVLAGSPSLEPGYTPTRESRRVRRRAVPVEVIEDVEWTPEREQHAQEEAQAPAFAPEPLPTLEHVPLDLESLELEDEPSRSTWGSSKQSSLETALRTGTLRTPYTAGIRGRD